MESSCREAPLTQGYSQEDFQNKARGLSCAKPTLRTSSRTGVRNIYIYSYMSLAYLLCADKNANSVINTF